MNQEKGHQIAQACREVGAAHKTGKITLEILDYELAKISLEFLGDYSPKNEPTKPIALRQFEAMTRDQIANLDKKVYEEKLQKYRMEKADWISDCEKIGAVNDSNLRWLNTMREALRKNNHQSEGAVSLIIFQHEQARQAA